MLKLFIIIIPIYFAIALATMIGSVRFDKTCTEEDIPFVVWLGILWPIFIPGIGIYLLTRGLIKLLNRIRTYEPPKVEENEE